ncbi:DUF4870 domain-containing protein [Actinotalea ferrariae]|uniref:DUF4870 domain-containing protein n=1 Tax=Actinotalea ferrariae TaxID=1386098 RepID=UPI001C8BE01D|nr:DUF4870 domain-containing protein [Actinotalea ferrariae]MBX9247040.1 DUF4870 domain-containing protein [Actinotalea ferrariae]
MTTNPSDEPQAPGTPPSTPAYGAPSTPGATPPPAYGTPPAGGYQQPPAGGYNAPPPGYNAPPPAPGYGAPLQPPLSDAEQRQWALFAHLGPIILGFIAPLVIWLVYKERGRFVEEQAKESLNFQITITLAAIAVGIISVVTFGLGGILYLAFVVALVFMIMAAVAVNKGEAYRYPVNIRFIK